MGAIADGVPEVLRSVREQRMKGASPIKLATGGGVASADDPMDVSQYTEAELSTAVEAAEDWNTYAAVHAHTPEAIQKSIRAGVKSIEHGQLMDKATVRLIAENDAWLSLQPFLDDEDATPYPKGSPNQANQLRVAQGTDTAYNLAQKYNLKTAWGTDTLFNPEGGSAGGKTGETGALVDSGRSAGDGNQHERGTTRVIGSPQSLSRQARRCGSRGTGGSDSR